MKKRVLQKTAVFVFSLLFAAGCGKKPPSLEKEGGEAAGEKSIYNMVYFGEISTLN